MSDDKTLTAEDARRLLDGATPGPWEWCPSAYGGDAGLTAGASEVLWPSTRNEGDTGAAWFETTTEGDRSIIAAASDLAAVIRLEAERDALADRVKRLERVLAVERGDESRAPEGWRAGPSGWCRHGEDGQASAEVERANLHLDWEWVVYLDAGPRDIEGGSATALEAMDAADAALSASGVDGAGEGA